MKTTGKKPSNRIEKLNSLIQKQLGIIIIDFLDPQNLVTITKVDTSRDLKWTKVWVSVLGDETAVLRALEKNVYEIQGELNRTLTLKVLPRIQFALDTSPKYAAHISELLGTITKEHGENE